MPTPAEIEARADAAIDRFEAAIADLENPAAQAARKAMLESGVVPHRPSKAHLIIGGAAGDYTTSGPDFASAVWLARSRDYDEQRTGKAMLEELGSRYQEMAGKSTLGDSDAAGGYLVPRVTAGVTESTTIASPVRYLLNVIKMRFGASVDVPLDSELSAPARASIVARGETKTNVNVSLASYSATFYTLARIFDVSNQLLRQSNGGAEKLVRSKLAKAFSLGESHYVLSGTGTNEPKGILTSVAAGPATYTSSHTASDSTIVGSVRRAVATMAQALAARGRDPDGLLLNPGDLAHAAAQGSDTGGFWTSGTMGDIGLPGVRIYTSAAVPSKTAILGEWKSADLFVGDDYRVDTSSEAGDRWDKNLTGFRGELELAWNADPYVLSGAFQVVTTLIP